MTDDTVLMWEVRAEPDYCDALVKWAVEVSATGAQVFRSDGAEPRVVIIQPGGADLPEPPAEYVARPPHAWHFTRVNAIDVDEGHQDT